MKPGLESGRLSFKNSVGKGVDKSYTISLLDEGDLPLVMDLQDVIVHNLNCSSLLQPFSSDFMREHLGRRGFVLGVFSEGSLVGFRNVYFPDACDADWNLGRDIGLPETELNSVANLQLVCVHPDYRGNGLALKMNRLALDFLRKGGRYHHVCATVSPRNVWNLPVLFKCGFHIRYLKPKYGGKMRYIVYQRLKDPITFRKTVAAKVVLDAFETQKQLFNTGHCAVDLVSAGKAGGGDPSDASRWRLVFRQPVSESQAHVMHPPSVGPAGPDSGMPGYHPSRDSDHLLKGKKADRDAEP